jgi:hypothetical protein
MASVASRPCVDTLSREIWRRKRKEIAVASVIIG